MTIRNILIATGSAIALASLGTAALAAGSVQTTAPASVTVLSPTTITKTQNLVFGSVIRPSNAGSNTVTLDVNDTVTIGNAGGGNGAAVASVTSSAKFDVTAPPATHYSTQQSLVFGQAGLTNVAASSPTATNGTLGDIPAGGVQELRYGGSFDMNAGTPAQAYTGTLSVTVNYN